MSTSSDTDEDERMDLVNFSNGFVFSKIFLPEEILLNLLTFVAWKDLLSCRLVCQTWKRVIDSIVAYEKLKLFSFKTLSESFTGPLSKLKSDAVPFYLYFAISNGAFGKNLLKNAFGSGDNPHVCQRNQDSWREYLFRGRGKYINNSLCSQVDCPKYLHWGVLESGGDGWAVEAEPTGSEPLPSHLPGRSCYVTSYGWCVKEQLIKLADHGLSSTIMDDIQPQFDVSEWYARRWDCGIRYKLQVKLLDHSQEVLHQFEEETGEGLQDSEWQEMSHSFKDYGPGVRYILFTHGGTDSQFWAGHYGCKIAGGSVIARIPISLFER